jgi:hypothetical protein
MRARTEPSTTGLTISRCEGLNASVRCTGPPGVDVGAEALVVLHVTGGQVFGRGVVELGEQVLGHLAQRVDQHVQAAAVGHADHDFLHALGAGRWISSSMAAMKLSPPSSEKRFWPTYLVCRKRSRPSAAVRRSRMCFFFSA